MSTPGGEQLGEAHIEVDMDTDPAVRALREFARDANGRLHDLRGRFVAEGEAIGRSLDNAGDRSGRFGTALRGLSSVAGVVGPSLGKLGLSIGAIGAAAGTAVPLLASVVAAVQNIAPAGAVAATGVLALQQATQTLKLGMVGVQDAVTAAFDTSAAGTKKFQDALDKLAPSAQAFVKTVRGLAPEFTKFQQSIQQQLFTGLSDALKSLSTTVLPVLRKNLDDTAKTLNGMALGAAAAAQNLGTSGTLGTAMAGANKGLSNLSLIPGQVVTALGQLAAAGAPAFASLTKAAAGVATEISGKLSDAFKSGALQKAVDGAVTTLKGLGKIAADLFGALSNVLGTVSESGTGAFTVLGEIAKTLKDVTGTTGFQTAIRALVDTMGVVAKTVGPLLGTVLGELGPLFTKIAGPVQQLVVTLGGALTPLLKNLGPILGNVLTALAGPLNALLADLGSALAPIFAALGPVLVAVARAVGMLVLAISPLLPVVGDLITSLLPVLTPILDTLTKTFSDLAPIVAQVGQILAAVLAPIIAALPTILAPLLKTFTTLTETLLPVVSDLLTQLAPVFAQLATAVGTLLVALAPLVATLGPLLVQLFASVIPIVTPVISLLISLASVLVSNLAGAITNVIVPAINILVGLFSGDLSGALRAVGALFTGIWNQIKLVMSNVRDFIGKAIDTVISIFQHLYDVLVGHSIIPDLVNAIIGWFTHLGSFFVRIITSIKDTVVGGFTSLWNSTKSIFGSVVATISGAMTSARNRVSAGISAIRGFFTDGFNRVKTSVSNAIDGVVSVLRGLGGRAKSALSGLGSLLYNSGRSLISGFINGIKSKLSDVKSAASSAASAARNFFGFSPAKEGPLSGKGWTLYSGHALAEDFAKGITMRNSEVKRAVNSLVSSTSPSFSSSASVSPFLSTARGGAFGAAPPGNVHVSATTEPRITVMIGNRVINDHVQVLIDKANAASARQQIQGVRR